jgi:hypothetical protein
MVIWDDQGHWKGVPERIEAALYGQGGGVRPTPPKAVAAEPANAGAGADMEEGASVPQPDNVLTFYSPTEAIAWAVEQGAFADNFAAEIAYEQLRGEMKPRNAKEMYIAWIGLVRKQTPRRRRA